MANNSNYFLKKKKLLMELHSDELNKNILYLINEVRTSPKQFSHHLILNDNNNKNIKYLSLYFKYSSREVFPLILDKNLSICSKDLLTHLILIDDGSASFKYNEEERIKNNLRERLKRLNLVSNNYNNFIIIGAENCLEAVINLLLNEDYKNKILSPEMNFIGIASGLLPSDNLCIIIDIVNSLKLNTNFNYQPFKYNNIRDMSVDYDNKYKFKNNNYSYKDNYNRKNFINNKNITINNNRRYFSKNFSTNNIKNYKSNKKIYDLKKMFNSTGFSPNIKEINKNKDDNDGIELRILGQNTKVNNSNNTIFNGEKEYKLPINIFIDKQYIRNKRGKLVPIYTKETRYDDGSILIQPNIDNYE